MSKPLIGISAYNYVKPENGWRYDISYGRNAAAVEKAGGLPVLIPSFLQVDNLRGIYKRLDAILIPGGGDVNPDRYQAEHGAILKDVDDQRDQMELHMAQWAAEDDMPLLGICRGIQLMNVALGGTLVQDIPSAIHTDLRHDIIRTEPRNTLLHDITIADNTRLASILGDKHITVNSLHHQALGTIAPSLRITATAPDGIVEGVEMADKAFFMAVQWHPEDLVDDDARMQRLFDEFVESARKHMHR